MNAYEKKEIQELPSQYRPIGAWGYLGYNILFSIPLIGIICMIVFACSGSNIPRRSYARSFLLAILLLVILIAVCAMIFGDDVVYLINQLTGAYSY